MAWVLYELGRDPEIERLLHAEIDAVVRDGPISPEHVPTLTYTRQMIREALRRYSPWANLLQASSPVDLGEGVRFPAGTTIATSPYLVHNDPRLFRDPTGSTRIAGHRTGSRTLLRMPRSRSEPGYDGVPVTSTR